MDLICILGPTAVGKTKLSIELAKKINAEIISGDAFQFYKGLDIGTAKASKEEQALVPHHLLDILDPQESFSVADYQKIVRHKIEEIREKNKTPILVGGSGLYLQSIIKDYQFKGPQRHDLYENMDLSQLQSLLKMKHPDLVHEIDMQNKRRLIRALEKSEDQFQNNPKDYYKDFMVIGLRSPREDLYQRIDQRVIDMVNKGLLDEVKKLYDAKIHSQATQAIGYKELYEYFDGQIDLQEAIALIQRNSRRYAKRQMTWFRNKMDVLWFDIHIENFDQTIKQVIETIKKTHPKMDL